MATQSDQTNTGVIATIVVVGSFAMITISAMVTAMVRSEGARLDAERPTNADLQTVAALEKAQLARLTAPARWVSEPGGKITLPIDRAMQVVVDQYRKDPAAASPPPPPGLQMNPTPPSAGAAPAAPGTPPAGAAQPGSPQPAGAMPSPAVPTPAAPDPAATPRVVPPPAAPGPSATPPPGPPTTPAAPPAGRP